MPRKSKEITVEIVNKSGRNLDKELPAFIWKLYMEGRCNLPQDMLREILGTSKIS